MFVTVPNLKTKEYIQSVFVKFVTLLERKQNAMNLHKFGWFSVMFIAVPELKQNIKKYLSPIKCGQVI